MKLNRISYALLVALAGTVALAGCKKKEETAASEPVVTESAPAPAATEPAPASVSTASVTIGNTSAPDRSVDPVTTFGTKDTIIVSVKTDAATATNAAIDAKLTFEDGQVAGQKTANVTAEDSGITNVEFSNADSWPAGTYKVDVTVNGQAAGMTQEIEVK